jgi:hypothetical protein
LRFACAGIGLVCAESLNFGGHGREIALGGALVFDLRALSDWRRTARQQDRRNAIHRVWDSGGVPACILQFLPTHDARALDVRAQVCWLTLAMAIISTELPWLMAQASHLSGANHTAMTGSVGRSQRYFSATDF